MDNNQQEDLLALRQKNIGRLFQRASRMYSETAMEMIAQNGHDGLTVYHTALISNLDIDGTRIVTLAQRAGMTKQAMGQLVKDLETRGYVSRVPDPDDKRAVLIQFTDLGKQFLQDAYEVKQQIEADYATILGDEGMKTLQRLLYQLLDHPLTD